MNEHYWQGVGLFSDFGLDSLPNRFRWPKNAPESYLETISLKHRLKAQWAQGSRIERVQIADEVIRDWGGIKGNRRSTIERYADLDTHSDEFVYKGVASYSKVLGIIDPLKFAILDARVVVSLNAIQLISDKESGVFFPYLSGRNKVTGDNANKRGFSQVDVFKKNSHLFRLWSKPKKNNVYKLYLDILRSEARKLNQPLYELEMALFADAENLALMCANKFKVSLC
ncbi:MAG: hypothetical protein P8O79_14910 [Halieaceae bacterium]|nr:hypothetical protein [Halieaceae bacterium]